MTDQVALRDCPERRGTLRPALESSLREMTREMIDALAIAAGFPPDWRTPDHQREAEPHAFLDARPSPAAG